jgi:uncharacterized protein
MNLADLKTPGVYVREIPTLPSSIVGVETAIPAFIGYTEKFMLDGKNQFDGVAANAYVPKAGLRISSMKEYLDNFGGPKADETTMTIQVIDTGRKYKKTPASPDEWILDSREIKMGAIGAPNFLMYYQMQMYFANGGGPCYVVPAGSYIDTIGSQKMRDALTNVVSTLDEPTLLLFPDGTELGTGVYGVYQEALLQCDTLKDRFVIMDLATGDKGADVAFRGAAGIGSNSLKYGAAYHPWVKTTVAPVYQDANVTIAQTLNFTDTTVTPNVALADADIDASMKLSANLGAIPASKAVYATFKTLADNERLTLPPSAAMAGLYAFTDENRGVWKAPANISMNQVIGLTVNYTDQEQENLNVDAEGGKSINIIRNFTGRGTLVWGARTLDGNSLENRYINVRRFLNYAEESIRKGMTRYVFEPNDANTWVNVRATIENFLRLQWQAGALQGAKPEQAYFVRVGLGQTMSGVDILEGRMIVQIGLAIVRPAEFIILDFMQKVAES